MMAVSTDGRKALDNLDGNLEELPDEEFMDTWTELSDLYTEIKDRLKAYNQEHQKRVRKEQIRRQMDLSEDDLALVQEVVAEGIESQENVGTPGKGGDQ